MNTSRTICGLIAAGAISLAGAQTAHAGAVNPTCTTGGVVTVDSTDAAVLTWPALWDFYVTSITADGAPVGYHRLDHDTFVTDGAVPDGSVIEVTFYQERNLNEGGDGYRSTPTTHRYITIGCAATPTTTSLAATTSTSVARPPLPILVIEASTSTATPTTSPLPSITTPGPVLADELPATGYKVGVTAAIGAVLVAVGAALVGVRKRVIAEG